MCQRKMYLRVFHLNLLAFGFLIKLCNFVSVCRTVVHLFSTFAWFVVQLYNQDSRTRIKPSTTSFSLCSYLSSILMYEVTRSINQDEVMFIKKNMNMKKFEQIYNAYMSYLSM